MCKLPNLLNIKIQRSLQLALLLMGLGASAPLWASEPEESCAAGLVEPTNSPEVKLIRDDFPEIFAAENDPTEYEIVSDEEARPLLLEKLIEEQKEFKKTPNAEEMADIWEVVLAIQKKFGLDPEEVERIRLQKLELKGGFDRNVVMKIPKK